MTSDKANESDVQGASAWYNKGITLDKLERCKEAEEAYDKAFTLDPNLVGN